ncbi:hypothetical protein DL95DRAFT_452997 [Leptodontidium sp. 2 PMI_412]|nr:hypothetical protein DL95DRAFT_452997 [Leptodontidium sp. 2 PMI_412]
MAAVARPPFQPSVNTAPPSPTSSTSTTALAPRPVHLAASGLWKPIPTLTQNYSHPIPTPAPTILSKPTSTPLTAIPRSTPTSASVSTSAKLLPAPAPALTAPKTPRSILKPGDIHPANRLPAYSPTASSSTTSSSLNYTSKPQPKPKTTRRSRGKSLKEGAFFAFVLLPLSCWYTRGGKRLGSMGGSGEKGSISNKGGKGTGEMVEWDADAFALEGEEEERRVRALPELRRPLHGRRDSLGQVGVGAGVKGQVAGRRQSFSASVPAGVSLGYGNGNGNGHGRSNSFSSVRSRGGAAGMGLRREVADYGVDKGAAAVDGEWGLEMEMQREKEREAEFERLRLSRAKSRTGSPVPLRRRRSEV